MHPALVRWCSAGLATIFDESMRTGAPNPVGRVRKDCGSYAHVPALSVAWAAATASVSRFQSEPAMTGDFSSAQRLEI